jgi:hypothetical protein
VIGLVTTTAALAQPQTVAAAVNVVVGEDLRQGLLPADSKHYLADGDLLGVLLAPSVMNR